MVSASRLGRATPCVNWTKTARTKAPLSIERQIRLCRRRGGWTVAAPLDSACRKSVSARNYYGKNRMKTPKVFVSYSHDSDLHKKWVAKLAADLTNRGIEIIIDQWNLALGEDLPAFMEEAISTADRVLLICTEAYVAKANAGNGGVGYERLIVSGEVVGRISTKKFIPIVRGAPNPKIPTYLGVRRYIDLTDEVEYEARVDELAHDLHGMPVAGRPPIGPNPYAATAPPEHAPVRTAGTSGFLPTGERLLSEQWFADRATDAVNGLTRLDRTGAMEVRFALHMPIQKSQLELLAAVRTAEVHTFGWPLGITLEEREEYKPRPFRDGIRAEVAIRERAMSGESSYDYWAAKNNGDFYILQSFFEDMRSSKQLFFNTQIVRITEGIMFATRFYRALGVPADSHVSVGFSHLGLKDRTLGSSTANRQVWPRQSREDRSDSQVTDTVDGLLNNVVGHVKKIAEPMFMLFEFATFETAIYDQIVTDYVKGRAT